MPGPFKHKLFHRPLPAATKTVASDFRDMAQFFEMQAPKGDWKVYIHNNHVVALNMNDMDKSMQWTDLGWQPVTSKELMK
jgi:hypothetical protein